MKKELPERFKKLIPFNLTLFLFILMLINVGQVFGQTEEPGYIRYSDEELAAQKATVPVKNMLKSAPLMLKSAEGSISVGEDNTYNGYSVEQLVKNVLVTGCLQANNIRFGYYSRSNGSWTNHNWSNTPGDRMLGYFSSGSSNFPINDGLLLSTGKISSAMGPNNTGNKSDEMVKNASDPDLASITGRTMYDAAVLEFDFVPAGNTLEFKYVFASEEYIEYCETSYNDAFGFFLSGPGISGPYTNNAVNLATIPGNIVVSINTIHPAGKNVNNQNFSAKNAQYYLDNPNGSPTMQFDGSTVELTATYPVIPCQTYRIKMAVADASDQKWDAGVFLGARSFNSETILLTNFGNNNISNNIFEDCLDNKLVITRQTSDLSEPYSIDLILGGSAINGTDIFTSGGQPFPTQITIPANQASIEIPYYAIDDGIADNNETFIVKVRNSCPCDINVSYVEKIIHIYEKVAITSLVPQNAQCNGQNNGVITVNTAGGSGSYEYSINNGSTWQTSNTFSNLLPGNYTVLVRDPGSCFVPVSQTTKVDQPTPIVANAGSDAVICSGTSVQLNGSGGVKYSWSPSTGLNNATIANPIAKPTSTTTYTLTVTNASGQCASSDQVTVTVKPSPVVSVFPAEVEICKGTDATLTASGALSYVWNPGGASTPSITVSPNSNANYTVIGTASNGCTGTASSTVVVKPGPRNVDAGAVTSIGYCETHQLQGSATGDNLIYSWSPATNLSNANIANPIFTPSASGTFTYTLSVTGENGCSETDEVQIMVADEVAISITAQTNVACFGNSTGSATITATGGTTPYTYSWNTTPTQIGATASGLSAGTYIVTVTDSDGCKSTATVIITEPATLSASASQDSPVVCNGESNGAASVTVTGGNAPYTYAWDKSASSSASATDLAAGLHTVTITDSKGCETTATVTVAQPDAIYGTDVQTACDTYTWIDGNTYTASNNVAQWTLTNAAGCDSVVTLDLTINNSTTGTDVQTACDSYTWIDGNTYTASNNVAQWTLTNAAGCDSVVTLDLTINKFLSEPMCRLLVILIHGLTGILILQATMLPSGL
ncbi:hypothetical protein MASR2M47_02120 [Draconibacterium sp.]